MTVDPGQALVVFAAVVALLAISFWPRSGVVPRLLRLSRLGERVRLEDALKHVYTCQREGQSCSLESLAGRLEISTARAATLLSGLTHMGMVRTGKTGPVLTSDGEQSAVRLVRTHRLWERYLADRTGVPAGEWHAQAEQMEHALSAEEVESLDSRLGHPPWDPHGDPIPTSGGDIPPMQGIGLVAAEPGSIFQVVHLEDEPPKIYDALLADGFVLGGRLEVLERTDQSVRVRSMGREWTVDALMAGNVTVRQLPAGERSDPSRITLLDANKDETVRVVRISQACQGSQRRRLLDLGVVRGAEVTPELVSAGGDPVAYRVRGALIALRRVQAAQILVERLEDGQVEDVA